MRKAQTVTVVTSALLVVLLLSIGEAAPLTKFSGASFATKLSAKARIETASKTAYIIILEIIFSLCSTARENTCGFRLVFLPGWILTL